MPTKVMLSNTRMGVYHLIGNCTNDGIFITAPGLLELASWIEQNKDQLELEERKVPGQRDVYWVEDLEEHTHIQHEWRE